MNYLKLNKNSISKESAHIQRIFIEFLWVIKLFHESFLKISVTALQSTVMTLFHSIIEKQLPSVHKYQIPQIKNQNQIVQTS